METNQIVWEYKRLCIPDGAENVLGNPDIRVSASSSAMGFDPAGACNGQKTLLNWGKGNGWQSAPVNWHPSWWGEWLRIDLPKPAEIDTVVVYGYPEMVRNRPWHVPLHFQVQCLGEGDAWVTLATVRHNRADTVPVTFPMVSTTALRVWINRNHYREETGYEGSFSSMDEAPKLLEVEAYRTNGVCLWRTESGSKERIAGPGGCAALFSDPAFKEQPAVDMKRLLGLLSDCGLGVTLLTAEELAVPELFSAANFNLFVHPYGRFVPDGANLYDFLAAGGHLLTFGGRAFTALKQRVNGEWIQVGIDPAITVSAARYVDYFRPFREQLTMFSIPDSRLEGVAGLRLNPAQSITGRNVDAACAVEGWMALGAVGELQPIDETRRYAAEGRMPWINHAAREGIQYEKCDTPILWGDGQDENYGSVFAYACSRWVSLVNCVDQYGADRGPLLSLMPHYAGVYNGSCWIFSGAENVDVLTVEGMPGVVEDAIRFAMKGLTIHDLEPGYACYHPGEAASFSVIVDNAARFSQKVELRVSARVRGSSEPLMTQWITADLEPAGWQRFDFACGAPEGAELVDLSCELWFDGQCVDRIENGYAVWNAATLKHGPNVTFEENFFRFDGKARYVVGARDSGLHLPWQPETNAPAWDALYST
ncbi:MAG: discoidin domain-containing protein, partial [Clostridia bacterium]|nr:discoidin domain-containing protein [Clostridia bacterium]